MRPPKALRHVRTLIAAVVAAIAVLVSAAGCASKPTTQSIAVVGVPAPASQTSASPQPGFGVEGGQAPLTASPPPALPTGGNIADAATMSCNASTVATLTHDQSDAAIVKGGYPSTTDPSHIIDVLLDNGGLDGSGAIGSIMPPTETGHSISPFIHRGFICPSGEIYAVEDGGTKLVATKASLFTRNCDAPYIGRTHDLKTEKFFCSHPANEVLDSPCPGWVETLPHFVQAVCADNLDPVDSGNLQYPTS